MKFFKKLWSDITGFLKKIMHALGFRGRYRTLSFLSAQPMTSGYLKDPLATYMAEIIASGEEISSGLLDRLSTGKGVDLYKYYQFGVTRVKKHKFETKFNTNSGVNQDDFIDDTVRAIVDKYYPQYINYPYELTDYSFSLSGTGAAKLLERLYARLKPSYDSINNIVKDNTAFPNVYTTVGTKNVHVRSSLINKTVYLEYPSAYIIPKPVKLDGDVNTTWVGIRAILIGYTPYINASGQDAVYPVLLIDYQNKNGTVPIAPYTQTQEYYLIEDRALYNIFYDNSLYHIVCFLPKDITELERFSQVTRENGINGRLPSVKKYYEQVAEEDTDTVSKFYAVTETVEINETTDTYTFTKDIILYSWDKYDMENLTIFYADEKTEENHVGLRALIIETQNKLNENENTVVTTRSNLFKFFPYIPLKVSNKYLIDYASDPFEGTDDTEPKVQNSSGNWVVDKNSSAWKAWNARNTMNTDANLDKPLRTRPNRDQVKPRTVVRRLRKAIKNIPSSLLRKYEAQTKLIGQDYRATIGQLIHNKNDTTVHDAIILPSVTLDSDVIEVKQYWYSFFKRTFIRVYGAKDFDNIRDNKYHGGLFRFDGTNREAFIGIPSIMPSGTGLGNQENAFGDIKLNKSARLQTDELIADNLEDYNVDFSMSWSGMVRFQMKGKLTKPNRKTRIKFDVKIAKTNKDHLIRNAPNSAFRGLNNYETLSADNLVWVDSYSNLVKNSDADTAGGTPADNNARYWTCFCKQRGSDTIDIIAVQGLGLSAGVAGKGCSLYAYQYMYDGSLDEYKGINNMFTFPLDLKTLQSTGLTFNTRFAQRVGQVLVYSTYEYYESWLQSSAFKALMTIVQIIIIIFTFWTGYGAVAASAGWQAIVGTIVTRIAVAVAMSYALNSLVQAVAKLFGVRGSMLIAVIAVVAAAYYGYNKAQGVELPFASQVMMIAPAIPQAVNDMITKMNNDMSIKIAEDKRKYEQAMEKLEEEQETYHEYMDTGVDLSAFVAALTHRVEKMDTFLMRTLETDFNQFASLDYLVNSLENSLTIDMDITPEVNWEAIEILNELKLYPDDLFTTEASS